VVGREIAVKKYVVRLVRLSAEERAQLDELIRKGKLSAQLLTKARILLKADLSELGEGWSDSRITISRRNAQRADRRARHLKWSKYPSLPGPRRSICARIYELAMDRVADGPGGSVRLAFPVRQTDYAFSL
jgi:hypothetical protein